MHGSILIYTNLVSHLLSFFLLFMHLHSFGQFRHLHDSLGFFGDSFLPFKFFLVIYSIKQSNTTEPRYFIGFEYELFSIIFTFFLGLGFFVFQISFIERKWFFSRYSYRYTVCPYFLSSLLLIVNNFFEQVLIYMCGDWFGFE